MIQNCTLCGSRLVFTLEGELFCPNHGIVAENQEWIEPYEEGEEKDD